VSELSFAKFCAQVTRAESDIIGLPVVCSRLFRFSSFYVNKNSGIKTAADLKGKTIGSLTPPRSICAAGSPTSTASV
jgi:4,5-dihydroxyphthalate decarboxylase